MGQNHCVSDSQRKRCLLDGRDLDSRVDRIRPAEKGLTDVKLRGSDREPDARNNEQGH